MRNVYKTYSREDAEATVLEAEFWKPYRQYWKDGEASKLSLLLMCWLGVYNAGPFPSSVVEEALGYTNDILNDNTEQFINSCWLTKLIDRLIEQDEEAETLGRIFFALGEETVENAITFYGWFWNDDLLEEGLEHYFYKHVDDNGDTYYVDK